MKNDIINQVLEIASEVFELDLSNLSLDLKKDETPNWDSLAHLNLFLMIETQMRIKFSIDDIQNFKSLREIYEKILNLKDDDI